MRVAKAVKVGVGGANGPEGVSGRGQGPEGGVGGVSLAGEHFKGPKQPS